MIAVALLAGTLAQGSGWTKIPVFWEVDHQSVAESAVLAFSNPKAQLVPIDTGKMSGSSGLFGQFVSPHTVSELRFDLEDVATTGRLKTRIEATTCFATNTTMKEHGLDPASSDARMFEALSFLSNQNCSNAYTSRRGAEEAGQLNVSYSLWLSPNLSASANFITGQFHGRPDPRIFRDPLTNETHRLSTVAAVNACTNGGRNTCKEGVVGGGNKSNPYNGWSYKQGGYPPLQFGLAVDDDNGRSYWNIFGRSDDRIFVPKADCGFNAAKKYWPDKKICPGGEHEQVAGIWRAPFEALPLGSWLRFDWRIRWSAYAHDGGALLQNGTVSVRIADHIAPHDRTGPASVYVDINWSGPLGRHDDGRSPYFKMGIYNPSGSKSKISVGFRDFVIAAGAAKGGADV
jgi:hypothetical protein